MLLSNANWTEFGQDFGPELPSAYLKRRGLTRTAGNFDMMLPPARQEVRIRGVSMVFHKQDLPVATEAELQWFNEVNYDGLLGGTPSAPESTLALAECFRQWATLVRDRVELERLFDQDVAPLGYVFSVFSGSAAPSEEYQSTGIMNVPLQSIGYKKSHGGATHRANSATICAMTTSRVRALNIALSDLKAEPFSIVDEVLDEVDDSPFSEDVHITVRLGSDVPNAQVLEDFKLWLDAVERHPMRAKTGSFRDRIASWKNAKVLPYHDLSLFGKFTGTKVSVKDRFARLKGKSETQLGTLTKMSAAVFNDDTAQRLEHLAERYELLAKQEQE
jgi:hypothetical protein